MGYDPLDIAVLNTMDFNAVLMENWDAMVEEAEDDDDGAAEEDVWSATDAGPSTIPWPSTEQEEAPFVTDGRGRVVGSTCITI
jgi:hypothetical protein